MELTSEQLKLMDRYLGDLGFPQRTVNYLEGIGVFTLESLLECEPSRLLAIQNFGEKTLEEIYRILEGYGFYRSRKACDS